MLCLDIIKSYSLYFTNLFLDRYAARKSLMNAFRSHLHDFKARGSKPIAPKHTQAIDIGTMMSAKFSSSRRHIVWTMITLMCLLLLAYIYAGNTNWDDSWIRTPTKYNISALLEEGMDDDSILGPAVDETLPPEKKAKASKEKGMEPADEQLWIQRHQRRPRKTRVLKLGNNGHCSMCMR